MGIVDHIKNKFKKPVQLLGYDNFRLSDITIGTMIQNISRISLTDKGVEAKWSDVDFHIIMHDNCYELKELLDRVKDERLVRAFITNKDGTAVKDIETGQVLQVCELPSPLSGVGKKVPVYTDGQFAYLQAGVLSNSGGHNNFFRIVPPSVTDIVHDCVDYPGVRVSETRYFLGPESDVWYNSVDGDICPASKIKQFLDVTNKFAYEKFDSFYHDVFMCNNDRRKVKLKMQKQQLGKTFSDEGKDF